jgi:protein TonB
MAYLDKRKAEHRTIAVIAVTALEAATIFAVVKGLTNTFVPHPAERPPVATNVPLDPAPTTKPEVPDRKIDDPHVVKVNTPVIDDSLTLGLDGGYTFIPGQTGETIALTPQVKETPSFAPRVARPRNAPGLWVREIDYPRGDLHQGHAGSAHFRLTIDAEGRVTSCAIVSSTGYPGLDAATCAKVSERAQFEPATDSTGARTGGSYTGTVRWVIPD